MERGGGEKTKIILINTFEVLEFVPIRQIRHDRTFNSSLPRFNLTGASPEFHILSVITQYFK